MDQDRFAGLELGIVEQHVLDRAEGDGRQCRTDRIDAGRGRNQQARRQINLLLCETIEMEAVHAGNMFAEIIAAFAAGAAETAGARAIDRHQLTRQHVGDARPDRLDDAGGFSADDQRHLALGKCHAAPAPDVDMVERHRLDTQRHLAGRGRLRFRQNGDPKLAVVDQLQRAHDV